MGLSHFLSNTLLGKKVSEHSTLDTVSKCISHDGDFAYVRVAGNELTLLYIRSYHVNSSLIHVMWCQKIALNSSLIST